MCLVRMRSCWGEGGPWTSRPVSFSEEEEDARTLAEGRPHAKTEPGMQRCVHEFTKARTSGHPRSWERTVSLGTSRGSQPCPQVDFRPPELRGRKTQPQETSEKAGSCEGRGGDTGFRPFGAPQISHGTQPSPSHVLLLLASQPCPPALPGHLGAWYPLLEGTKDPSAAHGPDTKQSKCLRSRVRHQAPCWAPWVSLKPNRKELGERARPASPHGSSMA